MTANDRVEQFDQFYRSEAPPWDLDAPQSALVDAFARGWIMSPVLDVGCGSGSTVRYLASRGLRVVGIDLSPAAIAIALRKCVGFEHRVDVRCQDLFMLRDASDRYGAVLDIGTLHTIEPVEARSYLDIVRTLLRPDGRLILVCFSDECEEQYRRRFAEQELRDLFSEGWDIHDISRSRFDVQCTVSNSIVAGPPAWFLCAQPAAIS